MSWGLGIGAFATLATIVGAAAFVVRLYGKIREAEAKATERAELIAELRIELRGEKARSKEFESQLRANAKEYAEYKARTEAELDLIDRDVQRLEAERAELIDTDEARRILAELTKRTRRWRR